MAYKFYPASSPIIDTPHDTFVGDLQAKINADWECASDIFTIQEELTVGQMDWQDVQVRIGHIIQPNTNEKLGDDWRNIIFKDMDHSYGLGKRYKFDNNVWLTVNSDFHRYPTASTIIRRCNNTLNFYYQGKLITEPCIIDYKPYRQTLDYNKVVTIQEGRIYVIAQANDYINTISENQRFLFNQRAYKIVFVQNYLQNNTFDQSSVPIISFYMDINQVNPMIDDVANNIANGLNQNVTNSSNVISSGAGNIVAAISEGDLQNYTVYNYDATGNQTNDQFTITASGVPNDYYSLHVNSGNSFTVNCIKMYEDNLLTVTCTNQTDNTQVQLQIQLKGLF